MAQSLLVVLFYVVKLLCWFTERFVARRLWFLRHKKNTVYGKFPKKFCASSGFFATKKSTVFSVRFRTAIRNGVTRLCADE